MVIRLIFPNSQQFSCGNFTDTTHIPITSTPVLIDAHFTAHCTHCHRLLKAVVSAAFIHSVHSRKINYQPYFRSKTPPPLFLAKPPPLKSAKCPRPPFLGNPPFYIGFL